MPEAEPLKILIVDDHAALRRTLRQLFDAPHVTMLEASSGEEAVEKFSAEHPDWVVMDLRMAGMGGIKATEAIHLCSADARVILISQFDEPEYREQARQAGAVDFVNKENMADLVSIIRNHPRLRP